jgi:hypothetical protein
VSAAHGTLAVMVHRAFLRLDSLSVEDMVTDAAVHVLAEQGAAGLSVKAVAAWLKVSRQRGSQMVTRERLSAVVAAHFANRWLEWIEFRRWSEGASSLLPSEVEEIAGVRVWLALCEVARERPDLTEFFERARRRERAVLVDLDLGLDDHGLDLILSTVEGLRVRLCEPSGPLALEDARSSLTRLLDLLGAKTAVSG